MGRRTSSIGYDDVAEKLEDFEGIDGFSPVINGTTSIKNSKNTSISSSYIGCNSDYATVSDKTISEGRFLTSFDISGSLDVAVIGSYVAKELFPENDAVGSYVKINGQKFKVVGIFTETASSEESSSDDMIAIPYTVATRLNKMASPSTIMLRVTNPDEVLNISEKIEMLLFDLYGDEDLYRVTSMEAMLETLNSVTGTLMIVLGGIAAISLIVGGIGIMNIMIVSVTERTREIGIRKAIGARKINILIQFLIESLIITGFGGIIGIALGCLAIFAIGQIGLVPSVYSSEWIFISFGVSLGIGLIFGLFPAYKAASMNPIDALRTN